MGILVAGQISANEFKANCQWSKDPSCWDVPKADPAYGQITCPQDFKSVVIVINVNSNGAWKTCSAYTLNEYSLLVRNSSLRISPTLFDCSRAAITLGSRFYARLSYHPVTLNRGMFGCVRYLKGY